jgi:hypothetical protein
MQRAAITYGKGELEVREQEDVWTVRLANLEARAQYLDLALAELLGNAPEAHRAAARLLSELEVGVDQQEAANPRVGPLPRRRASRPNVSAKPVLLGFRVVVFASVATAAFMLTTLLTALR